MAIDGASVEADTDELRFLVDRAVGLGITRETMEDELVKRTGFGNAVRGWFRDNQIPNGLVRRMILNSAKHLVSGNQH